MSLLLSLHQLLYDIPDQLRLLILHLLLLLLLLLFLHQLLYDLPDQLGLLVVLRYLQQ